MPPPNNWAGPFKKECPICGNEVCMKSGWALCSYLICPIGQSAPNYTSPFLHKYSLYIFFSYHQFSFLLSLLPYQFSLLHFIPFYTFPPYIQSFTTIEPPQSKMHFLIYFRSFSFQFIERSRLSVIFLLSSLPSHFL